MGDHGSPFDQATAAPLLFEFELDADDAFVQCPSGPELLQGKYQNALEEF